MGRVKPSQARQGVSLTRGIPFFKWDMGKKYKIVFPIPKGDDSVFLYQEAVHNLNINGRFQTLRCVNADYQVSEDSKAEVVRVDTETGELLTDKSSGRVLNDGSCPLCELEYLYRQWIFQEVEQWKEEHPDAEKKEISKQYRERFNSIPVSSVYNNNDGVVEISTANYLLGIAYKLDDKANYVLDKEGFPVYEINVFNFSQSRLNKIMTAVENNKEYMSDKLKAITDEDGLAWSEIILDFPKKDDKAQSGKDLSITVVPSGYSAVERFDALKDKIEEEIADVEELDETFENLPSLRVRSIPELEKELQGKLQQYRDLLSDEEKEELDKNLSEDEKYISNEDAESLLEEELNSKTATDFEDKEEAGENSFLA